MSRPAPGDYEIKGQFEQLVDKVWENKFKVREMRGRDIQSKNILHPLDYILDRDERNKSVQLPGPGQYNLPRSFDNLEVSKKSNSKICKYYKNNI